MSFFKTILSKLNLGEIEKEGELTAEMAAAAYSGDTVKFLDDLIALLQEFRTQKVAALAAQADAATPATLIAPMVAPTPVVTPATAGGVTTIVPFSPVVPSTTAPTP